jgi:hypothetical protein
MIFRFDDYELDTRLGELRRDAGARTGWPAPARGAGPRRAAQRWTGSTGAIDAS